MTVTEDRPTNQQTQAAGRVVRVTGPVVDVEFPRDAMPDLFNALKVDVTLADLGKTLTLEVAQHLGEGVVRTISMAPTDGLVRGAEVTDTGSAISVPVGDVVTGHVWNALGECLDEPGYGADAPRWTIHRHAPRFDQLEGRTEMLETGIKVIDLLTPVRGRREDRPVRRGRRRQDRADPGDDPPGRPGVRWRLGVRRRRRAHP